MMATPLEEITNRQQMELLCHSFPSLRGAAGTAPWDQLAFARWAHGGHMTNGSRMAAAFVLAVWNGQQTSDAWWTKRPYRVPLFDLTYAWSVWDAYHKVAFLQWCHAPFYP